MDKKITNTINVGVQKIDEKVKMPKYMSNGAACMDLCAYMEGDRKIAPGETKLIGSGLKMAIPKGYKLAIVPRSGLAIKHNLTVLNSPGTIDSDYRGEIKVIISNFGNKEYVIKNYERICQISIEKVIPFILEEKEKLSETVRGENGFGHTGVKS